MRPQSALRSQAASVSSSPIDPTQRWYSAFFADWSCRNGRNATPGTSSWMDDGESIKRGAGSTSLGQKVYGGKGTAIFERSTGRIGGNARRFTRSLVAQDGSAVRAADLPGARLH